MNTHCRNSHVKLYHYCSVFMTLCHRPIANSTFPPGSTEEPSYRCSAQPPASSWAAALPQPPIRPESGEGSCCLYGQVKQSNSIYRGHLRVTQSSLTPSASLLLDFKQPSSLLFTFGDISAAVEEERTTGICCFRLHEVVNTLSGKYLPQPLAAHCWLFTVWEASVQILFVKLKSGKENVAALRVQLRRPFKTYLSASKTVIYLIHHYLKCHAVTLSNQASPLFWLFEENKWIPKCIIALLQPLVNQV